MFKKGLVVIIVGLLFNCGKDTWAQKLDTNYKSMNYPTKQISASYKGGMGAMILFIDENLQLPKKRGLKATILINININEEGSITNINILSGINKEVDKAIIEVIQKMPKWNPATVNGVAIPSEQVIGYNISY
ncbi:MAG: TonB family protein [Bacteroidales bacterium]|nr:TonB family protein [Bacteroidales bacterium]